MPIKFPVLLINKFLLLEYRVYWLSFLVIHISSFTRCLWQGTPLPEWSRTVMLQVSPPSGYRKEMEPSLGEITKRVFATYIKTLDIHDLKTDL